MTDHMAEVAAMWTFKTSDKNVAGYLMHTSCMLPTSGGNCRSVYVTM